MCMHVSLSPKGSCRVSPGPRWDVGRKRTTPQGLRRVTGLKVYRAKEKKKSEVVGFHGK